MSPDNEVSRQKKTVDTVAMELLDEIQSRFPVCLTSDEFHFFPHGPIHGENLSRWDDFSFNSVLELINRCNSWKQTLVKLTQQDPDLETQTDINLLQWMMTILIEQLELASPQRTQPTFHLTIAGIGLAQAYEHGAEAWRGRLRRLPEFMNRATSHLETMPHKFREPGIKMAAKVITWLKSLGRYSPNTELEQALKALKKFRQRLTSVPATEAYLLPTELYARVAETHFGIGLPLSVIQNELESELNAAEEILVREATFIDPRHSWRDIITRMLPVLPAKINGHKIYQDQVAKLEQHCIEVGLVPKHLVRTSPVVVRSVPEWLIPMRSAAAYSMEPGHPPSGGTFYLMPGDLDCRPSADWHLLSAHETYPGHHLLDTARWSLKRPLRRHLEFPLFYEGWASYSEELLFVTGFCSGSRDRILMAKRRFYRAIRGKVDLMMNQGAWDWSRAVHELCNAGYPQTTAERMILRYALKPGYQLCYTLGRRRFRNLHRSWTGKGGTLKDFCRHVLSLGEISFADLELHLAKA
jgi:uncharacterized protein (DUF885 family)